MGSVNQPGNLPEGSLAYVLVLLEFQQSVDDLPPAALLAILPSGRIPRHCSG